MTLLTVSMPVGGNLDRLPTAVRSVLDQDVGLHLVVVNDGLKPASVYAALGDLALDERVTVYDLPESRGRYFADALVYAATDTPYFTIHDADDWSGPGRFARMIRILESSKADVVAPSLTRHYLRGTEEVAPARRPADRPPHARHLWNLPAIYRRPALQGMMGPAWRIGYDSLLCYLLWRTCRVTLDPIPDYHWVQARQSLTTDPRTGSGTPTRQRVREKVIRKADLLMAGRHVSRDRAIRILGPTPVSTLRALQSHTERLRRMLDGPPVPVDASDVVLTILTGARPRLLDKTLESVAREIPGLLDTAQVVVLHNGADPETAEVVESHRKPGWEVVVHEGDLLTIGQATSRCAILAYSSTLPYWLHLEDDWQAHADNGGLDLARKILQERFDVSQVRLRQSGEVNPKIERWARFHMVTHEPLQWEDHGTWALSPNCHLTQTPFLMRSLDALDAYPAAGEREAMRKWWETGHRAVARIQPGYFTHIGDRDSLKRRTRCPL